MLKMTEIELELISDIKMHLFIGKGSISYIPIRYSKANNKYMTDYDSSEKNIFIIYLEANNLYGWAISNYLPYGEFEWLSQEEIQNFDVNSISKNSFAGYILEFDLEYPDELHDFHNDYP